MDVWAFRRASRTLLALLLAAAPALADPGSADGAPGNTTWALPGIARVGVPGAHAAKLSLAGAAGYGFTEGQQGEDGAHHRILGSVAASFVPLPALELALRFDGRHDRHPDDGDGAHGASVGNPRFLARIAALSSGSLHLGGELGVWLPGEDAPSVAFDATTVDVALLAALVPDAGPVVAFKAGFRLDGSANAAPDLARVRPGDRLALGLSDSNAVLLGAGVSVPLGKTELLGELSWDVLIGADAPSAMTSPLRVTAGARHALSESLSFQALAEVSPSSRPDLGPGDPLVPVEPRFGLLLGLGYRFPSGDAAGPAAPKAPTEQAKPTPVAAPEAAHATTVVRIADADGKAVRGAKVTVKVGAYTKEAAPSEDGSYRFEDVPAGDGTVSVQADGFPGVEQPAKFGPGAALTIDVELEPGAPSAQLRGLIRSFAGHGIRASIRVEPLGVEVKSDADGTFAIDVAPGDYEVVITAEKFKEQHRKVHVGENGVTVLNAELFEAKR